MLNFSYSKPISVRKFWRVLRASGKESVIKVNLFTLYPCEVLTCVEHNGFIYVLTSIFIRGGAGKAAMSFKDSYASRLNPEYNKE